MCLIPVIYIRYDCCHVFSCPDWGQTRNSGRPTSTAGFDMQCWVELPIYGHGGSQLWAP